MISVLLVDDEPALLDVTQIFLERDGKMRVTLSESAKDALQKLEKGYFDIIVADYEMPQMTGLDLLKAVKNHGYDIPFIIFTGRGREHVAIEALNLGASFYLQKGGDPKSQFAELRNMIMQAVQKKRAEEEIRLNQMRLQAVIELYQMSGGDAHDLCMYALDKAIALSGSRMGFLAFVNEQETVLTMYAWSRSALDVCSVRDRRIDYPLEKTGLWGDPVRQRRAIITNDYSGNVPGKRGYPEGHPPLTRYMGVPILDGSRIVMVIGLANKETGYTENDVQQVTLLMGSLWQVLSRKRVESDLIASEKRFRSYFELPLAGIAIATPDLRWLQVNQKFCQMLGYSATELGTHSWTDLTPEEDREREMARLSRVVSGEEQFLTLEKKFQRKDGSLMEVEVSAMPVRKPTGEVDYFVALVNDISNLKKTERELLASNEQMLATLEELRATQDSLNDYCHKLEREKQALGRSEARFRTMVETAPSLLFILDRAGKIEYASPHAGDFSGYQPAELKEIGIAGIIHEKDEGRIGEEISRAIREGTGFRDIEFVATRKDGTAWFASCSMEPLPDESGTLCGFLAQVMDVTSRKEAEEALRQSEERLRKLVETINDVVFSLDPDGRITYVSPAVTKILGYLPGELEGRLFTEFLPAMNAEPVFQLYSGLKDRETPASPHRELQVVTQSGEERWCRVSLIPVWTDGEFSGCSGTLTDIHEQWTAREELKEREALLRGILRATPAGIGVIRDRVFVFVNKQICRMTGYSREELVGKSSRLFYPSDEEHQRVLTGYTLREGEHDVASVESTWIRKDGSLIDVSISVSPLEKGDWSGPLIFTVSDITEQKTQKNALLESELSLRTFINAIPGPSFLLGKGGEIITANDAFWKCYGGGKAHPPGTTVYSLMDRETGEIIRDHVEDALGLGRISRFEMMHDSRSLIFDASPVRDNQGRFSRVAVFSVDITDQKRAQEMLALYNRKLSLLGRVTRHDAGNLLAAVKSYHDQVKKQTDDPLILTYIRKGERNLQALENVLAFAEDYQAVGMRAPAWQDVNAVIRKVAGMHDLKNVTILLDCDDLVVHADPLLEKVFSALIQNAIQHGRKTTRVSFSYRKNDSGIVLVCEDDGIGIAPEKKEEIFEMGVGENTGFGLFLVREILSMTGFSIRETGEPGHGARFEIAIPAGSFQVGTKDLQTVP
ncbi:MAG: PAS domain S-box protein [Methanolinea sp.]|nr:PAS domain S-box protein [Methanolinea sp.]